MFPKLFSYGPFVLPTYGVLVATGFLIGLLVAVRLAGEEGLERDKVYNLGVYLAVAGMLGSKGALILQDWNYYWRNPGQLFTWPTLQSGGIFYGGLVLAIVTGLWYTHARQLPFLKTADAFAPGIALGHSIGRLGCFSAGCCWGKATSLPWGVTFTNPYSHEVVGVPLGISLHPTQLYESAAELAIFLFLYSRYRKKQFDGQILGWYLLLYPAARFSVEFLRDHSVEAVLWGGAVSAAQGISFLLLVIGVWLVCLGPYRHRRLAPVLPTHDSTASQRGRPAKLSSR
jgi:phosphatidylglycerol:prolipoprotein diacylglycerol transferase